MPRGVYERILAGTYRECPTCRCMYYVPVSHKDRKNGCCSSECSNVSMGFNKEKRKTKKGFCILCGKEMNASPSKLKTFCSYDCANKHKGKTVSEKLAGKMPANINRPGKFGNVKRGYYNIGGTEYFFRSKWEANYAIYLNWLKTNKEILDWGYEKDVFMFDKIKTGTRSYRPDFKITNKNNSTEYHEVKGWVTPKSKTQIKRMRIYHPEVKLLLIDSRCYRDIADKVGKMLKFY